MPDGKTLAAASVDNVMVRTWNLTTLKPLREFVSAVPFRGMRCLVFTADGKRLVAGGANQIRQ